MKLTYNHTVYACYFGYVTQAIVNNLAPLLFLIFQDAFGIPLGKITLLITVNFFIQLTVDFLAARFVDSIGYRKCIVAAHLFATVGILGLGFFPFLFPDAFVGLLTAVFFYSLGGGLLEVLVSPIVEACPTDNKSAVMSLLHSFYCWGVAAVILLTTLSLTVFGREHWPAIACIWAAVPVLNGIFFLFVPIAPLVKEGESMRIRDLFKSSLFWIFMVLMLAAGASEQAMSQWASAFAESGLGVTKAVGDLAGPFAFAILMGTSRVLYARFSEKISLLKFIIGSSILCIAGYLLAAFAASPILSLIGCGVVGFSVGILWPGTFSLAAEKMPTGGTALFALLALAGDGGCGGGPTLVGLVASAAGDSLKTGLAFGLIFPVLMIVFGLIAGRRKEA